MKKWIILLVFLQACISVPKDENGKYDVPWYASKETFVVCQAADVGTTWWVLLHGGLELNPIGLPILIAIKVGLSIYRWQKDDEIQEAEAGLVLNLIACAPVPNNIAVIRQIRKE